MSSDDSADVLVVGAGPTGLTLAAQLAAHGVRPRLVDRARDRVHESRALAIQPRTLEVLCGLGITPRLQQIPAPLAARADVRACDLTGPPTNGSRCRIG
jgi:2-polyprenyl-6-methoxyphenol hydroxylase-like FAD-dependent oxidoreductase